MDQDPRVKKCVQTLKVLIDHADVNGIVLAERAVDELIAAIEGKRMLPSAIQFMCAAQHGSMMNCRRLIRSPRRRDRAA
jgi:hypothetical protein